MDLRRDLEPLRPEDPPTVRALRVPLRTAHVRARAREWMRDRFWFLPLVIIVASVLAALLVSRPDAVHLGATWPFEGAVEADRAIPMLQVMASSMLTFVGVVFAITLVALQLASSQVSPRVIRTFVRSPVTKAAFGVFLGTFAFAVTALVTADVEDPVAAARTVLVASLLVGGSIFVFLVYVTATMKLLEVGWVVTAVAEETRAAIRTSFPDATDYVTTRAPLLAPTPHDVSLPVDTRHRLRRELGTVLGVDQRRLVTLAASHDCVIELVPRIGEYLITGATAFRVHGEHPPPDLEVLACLDLGRVRTLFQDPTYGLRQLVDVATQSLSPAINQPTTAVLVIDRLHDLLLRIAHQPWPTGLIADDHDVVRFVEPVSDWTYLCHLAFDEITALGSRSAHVTRRLAAAFDDMEAALPADHGAIVRQLRESLQEQVLTTRHAPRAADLTAPDRLGLG